MSLSSSARLLDNAKAALISAIEIYNKPTFAYREETFAILALNAWELLLKAKLLEVNGNKLKCLHIYAKRELAPGRLSKKEYAKRNRTGKKPHITTVSDAIATVRGRKPCGVMAFAQPQNPIHTTPALATTVPVPTRENAAEVNRRPSERGQIIKMRVSFALARRARAQATSLVVRRDRPGTK
jgi:hypothetical protein